LRDFIENEIALRAGQSLEIWQQRLTQLFNFMIRHGLPVEQLGLRTFQRMQFQACNAEESLLVVLHACAQLTKREIKTLFDTPFEFGDWYVRLGRHETRGYSGIAYHHLSRLNLAGCVLSGIDFVNASLDFANLSGANADYCNFAEAYMHGANLRGSSLVRACFDGVHLVNADLVGAHMLRCNLRDALIANTNFTDASLAGADLRGARLDGADLTGAVLTDAILDGARFKDAILKGTIFNASARNCPELQGLDLSEAQFVDPDAEPT
jgi:uncharacterized protein YjbI with pentapeptide repeats